MPSDDSSHESKRTGYGVVFATGLVAGSFLTAAIFQLGRNYDSSSPMYGDPSASYPLWMELAGPVFLMLILVVLVVGIGKGYFPRRI